MDKLNQTTARGESRSPGPNYASIINSDRTPPPAPLTVSAYAWIDTDEVDIARYTSRAYHELESELLWPSTWQMACRVEHIPNIGDYHVYEICDLSIIVVRAENNEIRAFHNSCLHRGTTLAAGSGNTAMFKCPFHGFTWGIDGRFRGMPAQWDFPHIDRENFGLPEAAVAVWGGFVMVNPDHEAQPFEEYAAPLTEHFKPYPLEDRFVAYHACQVVDANWKTTQEAFLEGYHVSTTHPHTLRFANDLDCAYDVLGENVSRLLQALAVPATHLVGEVPDTEMATTMQKMLPLQDRREVPQDVNARAWLAERFRDSFSKRWRCDLSQASQAELLDSIQYFMFPNFAPWGGYAIPITYRFRPWADDPNQSLMEVLLLHPLPQDGIFQTAEPHWLEKGESWSHAPGFAGLGIVIDQDIDNLPKIQKGLRAARHKSITLSDYQEIRIRHFHKRLNQVLGAHASTESSPS